MSNETLLLLLLVAVVANVVLSATFMLAAARPRAAPAFASDSGDRERPEQQRFTRPTLGAGDGDSVALQVATADADVPEARAGLTPAAYDRVVRIVGFAFLAAVATVVATSGLYPGAAPAIYIVLGIAAFLIVLVHDVLPTSALGPGKVALEGSAAIALVTVLVALTGGLSSPFFFGYYLIVAASALVLRGGAATLVAAGISLVYIVAMVALPGFGLALDQLFRLAFNVASLWLLAYLASVVAREQRRTRDAAVRLSLTDPLTRLNNRSYFYAAMDREIQRAARTGRRFCLLMIDMDNLKPINDTFGHAQGDRVLRAVADRIRAGIRTIDAASRMGGDEFVVLLPETDPTGGFVVAEKLRRAVADIRLDANGQPVRTSVSIGVVTYPDDGQSADQLLAAADETMYESKRRGRNRVVSRGPRTRSSREFPVRARRRTTRRVTPAQPRGRRREPTTPRPEPVIAGAPAPRPEPAAAVPEPEPEPQRSEPAAEEAQERTSARRTGRRAEPGAASRPERSRQPQRSAAAPTRARVAPKPAEKSERSPRTATVERAEPPRRPAAGEKTPARRQPEPPEDEPGLGRTRRATRRFQVLDKDEEEELGRIMGTLLGTYQRPRPVQPREPENESEADNRPA